MNVAITPSVALGELTPPTSKSYAHRLLICAALSKGISIIENIGVNDDVLATAECLRQMGASVELDGTTATVSGIDVAQRKSYLKVFCNESGSTLRFLIPLSLVFYSQVDFEGSGRLMERPQSVYEELFREKGCSLKKNGAFLTATGELKSGEYRVAGDVSSQFITGLLFTLPLLEEDSQIVLTTPLQSAPYIDITIDVLSRFGVDIIRTTNGFFIRGSQQYKAHNEFCEGDWSNAAFLDGFNLAGGKVTLNGMNNHSKQGDKIYKSFYKMLCDGAPELDIEQYPDLGPVLIACAVLKNGALLKGTGRLRIKESDRGAVMGQELEKFGVKLEIGDNYIRVPDCSPRTPTEPIDCHNDHRIAMSFALLCSVTGGTLHGAQCVNKSYPGFFEDIRKVGIIYKINPEGEIQNGYEF